MKLRDVYRYMTRFRDRRVPGQLVIQITNRCNALCPQCGMRITEPFRRADLSIDDVRRILDTAALKGIEIVSFTGGEPLLFPDELRTLIEHAGSVGIKHIRTGTNGFLFRNGSGASRASKVERLAESLARTPLRNFWISIDSAIPAVHESMRGFPGVIAGIEEALPIFHRYGIYPSANVGINRNIGGAETRTLERASFPTEDVYLNAFRDAFKRSLENFYRFVADLGFTMVSTCYPMSIGEDKPKENLHAVYGATSQDPLVRFDREEKAILFKTLLETLPQFRSRIRVFSPGCSLYALHRQYASNCTTSYPCRGGIDFFFIDARSGDTYPCGYRGSENLGRFWNLAMESIEAASPCTRCEWECFRDPSELFGPFLQGFRAPLTLLSRFSGDRRYFRLWLDDLRYYRACEMFDGRKPPDFEKLRRFGSRAF